MSRRPFTAVLVACAAAALAAPATAAPRAKSAPPAVRTGSDVEAIRAIGKRWQELYTSGRYAEIPELYTEDTLVMPRGRPAVRGREEMRRSVGGLAAGRRVNIEVTERDAFVSGDYGWFVSDFRVTYAPREPGAAPAVEFGRSLVIFRRDADGRWRIHRDMDNPAPGPASAQSAQAASANAVSTARGAWDPKSRTAATACDRLASSRYDRTRLAKPMAREDIDVPAAIAQCEADLRTHPGDPRIHFHLGRLYGYAGDPAKTLMHRKAAAEAGNHNAIFLLGYLAYGSAKDEAGRCTAAAEMRRAADLGNYSAQLTYASYYLEGRLEGCQDRATRDQVVGYVKAARPAVDGFFETRLAEHLAAELAGGGQR